MAFVRVLSVALVCAPVACDLGARTTRLIPADAQAELIRQSNPGAGTDRGDDKGEGCGLLKGCSDVACPPPFELKRGKGQCCPVCFAPDHVVALDRHVAMKGPSKYATKMASTAPASCKGVKCFKAVCAPGVEVGIKPNACCLGCKGFLQTESTKSGAFVQTKTAPGA